MNEFDLEMQQELNWPLTPEFRRRIADVKRNYEFGYDRLADQAWISSSFPGNIVRNRATRMSKALASRLADVIARLEGTSGTAPVEAAANEPAQDAPAPWCLGRRSGTRGDAIHIRR